jgi:hypothetical protein
VTDPGYPFSFAPVPRWIFEWRRRRLLTESEKQLLEALFHLAKARALKNGEETPAISLDLLVEYVDPRAFRRNTDRRRAHDAVRKRIERAAERGLLGYRCVGSTEAGFQYVFRLPIAAPVPSEPCPSADGTSRPTPAAVETGSPSEIPAPAEEVASELERGRGVHSRPTGDTSRPRANTTVIPGTERDSARAGDASRPSPRDVRDVNQLLTEGSLGPSRAHAHARAREDLDPDVVQARLTPEAAEAVMKARRQ